MSQRPLTQQASVVMVAVKWLLDLTCKARVHTCAGNGVAVARQHHMTRLRRRSIPCTQQPASSGRDLQNEVPAQGGARWHQQFSYTYCTNHHHHLPHVQSIIPSESAQTVCTHQPAMYTANWQHLEQDRQEGNSAVLLPLGQLHHPAVLQSGHGKHQACKLLQARP